MHFIRTVELDALHGFLGRKRFALPGTHFADVAAAAGLDGAPFLFELAERIQFVAPHDHFRAFGLQQDFAFARLAVEGLVHHRAIHEILQRVALGNDFEAVPFTGGGFDVVLATKADFIDPILVAATPVDAAFGDRLARFALLPNLLFVTVERELGAETRGQFGVIRELWREHEDVANAAFDDLRLDAGHPGVAVSAVRAVGVQENAVVLRGLLAFAPGLRAPFEFNDEMVVAVVFLRGDITITASADVEGAILGKGPDVLRVVMEIHLRIDVVLDVACFDDLKQVHLLSHGLGQHG